MNSPLEFIGSDVPDDPTPLSRATFVSYNSDSYIDDFAYMAAIPSSLFYYGGSKYISPLLFTGGSSTEQWLMEDWAEYLIPDDGIDQILSIGDLTSSQIFGIQDTFGTQVYPQIKGTTSAEIAAMLAVYDWENTDTVVLALAKDSFSEPTVFTDSDTYTFTSPTVERLQSSVVISDTVVTDVPFTPPSGVGWMEGAFNWTGDELFTHILRDPQDRPVDYSVVNQVRFERNPLLGYVDNPLPLLFWMPVTEIGEWTMSLDPYSQILSPVTINYEVTYHPCFSRTITIPQDASWLNVTSTWDNAGTNINTALIDPTGKMVMWAPAESLLGGAGSKTMNMPYPMAGDWTYIGAWIDPTAENNNLQVNWVIESLPSDIQPHLESASNAAVIASLLNAPLLYVSESAVPEITRWAIERLGATNGILVDPTSQHSASLTTELNDFLLLSNISTYPMLSDWIQTLSGEKDVVLTLPLGNGDELFAPAAYAAAYHGAPIFSLCGDNNVVPTRAEETWAPYLIGPEINIFVQERYATRAENGWYDERIPNKFSMFESSNYLKDFLLSRNAYNVSWDQSAIIVAATDIIKTSFDRSLQSHFACGRFPTSDSSVAAAMINRAALHRFLFSVSQNADEALLSLYAYTYNYPYADNFGNPYTIQQIDNTVAALQGAGFSISAHVGVNEVFQGVASQVGLWSLSTHGTLTEYPTDPPQRPDGLGVFSVRSEDTPEGYGRESATSLDYVPPGQPSGDGLVNPVIYDSEYQLHILRNTNDLEEAIDNIGSPIVVITACLLGGSKLPAMLMEHGAVAVTAAPRTVYFRPAGLLSILFTESITQGNTTGDALAYALRAISQDYTDPLSGEPRDYANQQILFGDPDICLYHPTTNPRIPSQNPQGLAFDGHTPGAGVDSIAGLGSSNYLPTIFNQIGADYDYYESGNYSSFLRLLSLRTTVIVEPGSLSSLSAAITADSSAMINFIHSGGTLVIAGVDQDIPWLPWELGYVTTTSSTGIQITDIQHPLLSYPNSLNEAIPYIGYFESPSANLTVLATGSGSTVAVASLYGTGKAALLTIAPTGTDAQDFFENAILWSQQPALYLKSISLNEQIIWEGDRLIISLTISDLTGTEISDADVNVWVNNTEVVVTHESGGDYSITLDEAWTSGKVGSHSILIVASKNGYDTLTILLADYFYIRPSPWLAIGIIVGIFAAVTIGWYYRKYRRGEPLRTKREKSQPKREFHKDDSKLRKKEEEEKRKQREKEDQEFDPKEFFGV
ncbi:MAG: hypothetical protein ACFFF4_07630 [Candidatus Thorarchaeota archaeon]